MSSRRDLPCYKPGHTCRVGWDLPMNSYFAEVRRGTKCILWLGSTPGEIRRAEEMVAPLAPYAVLDVEMLALLLGDRVADLDRAPTPLQRSSLKAIRDE